MDAVARLRNLGGSALLSEYRMMRSSRMLSLSGAIPLILLFAIPATSAAFAWYSWEKAKYANNAILTLSERLAHTEVRLNDLDALKAAARASQAYALVAVRAASLVGADVRNLAEMTRQGWESAARRYRNVDVPEFEPEYVCYEHD